MNDKRIEISWSENRNEEINRENSKLSSMQQEIQIINRRNEK